MLINKTEFGRIELEYKNGFYDVYLRHESKELHLGFIKDISDENKTQIKILVRHCMDRYIQAFLYALRFEAMCQKFVNVPTGNEFKDAYLRMMIELQGQTLEIRKYEEEIEDVDVWKTYPDIAEKYSLDDVRDISIAAFITPYGRYHHEQTDTQRANIIRLREGSSSINSELNIPHIDSEENRQYSLIRQMIESVYTDTYDTTLIKFVEVGKRLTAALKYLFGYDKLRRAIRKRSLDDSN